MEWNATRQKVSRDIQMFPANSSRRACVSASSTAHSLTMLIMYWKHTYFDSRLIYTYSMFCLHFKAFNFCAAPERFGFFLFLGPIWFCEHFGLPAPVLHFGAIQSEQSRKLWIHMKYTLHLKVLTAKAPQAWTNKGNFSHSLGFKIPNLPPDGYTELVIAVCPYSHTMALAARFAQ